MGIIKVRGLSERLVECDMLTAVITVAVNNQNAGVAMNTVDKRLEQIIGYLKGKGCDTSKLRLINSNVHKEYSGNDYRAKKEIELKAPLTMRFNNFLCSLNDQFEFSVEISIEYGIKNKPSIIQELMQEAFLDAKNKAEILASANGKKIIDVETINYGNVSDIYSKSDDEFVYSGPMRNLAKSVIVESDALGVKNLVMNQYIDVFWIIE